MNTSNSIKVENDSMVVFTPSKNFQDIDISEFKTEKDLVVIYPYEQTTINARNITARSFLAGRRDGDDIRLLCAKPANIDVQRVFEDAEKLIGETREDEHL